MVKDYRWLGSVIVVLVSLILLGMILMKANRQSIAPRILYPNANKIDK